MSNYRYNTLNQVIAQVSPDGGQSEFWYDVLGRLVVSQNAKQRKPDHYSYTVYDDLGRISEVGEMTNATAMNAAISRDPQDLAEWMHTKAVRDVTVTSYDIAYGESPSDPEGILAGTVLTQRNLRNRVSWSAIYNSGTFGGLSLGDHASATFYTYDIHGNVDTLVQDYLALFGETDFSRFKKIEYDYDLISGKVNKVSYQRGRPDQFYHRYAYDAENRLTGVQTSHDGWVWENDANYEYYKHGPLARTVIGQQQVQGIDYAYTVQGWLKGVNGTQVGDGTYDMGEDGKTGSAHSKVARDAYGFSLNYYTGSPWSDYHAIGATGNKFASVLSALSTNAKSLYNGNIAAMAVNIRGIGDAKLYHYQYDQLNRIVSMDAYSGLQNNNTWTPVASDDYKERVSYDANGNILTYLRNGATAVNGLAMDSLTYQYAKNNSGQLINNRLRYVHDRVAGNAYTEDIDSQTPLTLAQVQTEKLDAQTTDNYQYDEIGNLIKDTKEGITEIEWNVYGKIRSITKGAMTITYTYDASGNRISKVVTPASGPTRKTYYVRDASGNVMSVYEEGGLVNDGNLTQSEVHLYGSSRLGIFKPDVDMTSLVATDVYGYDRGKKFFELSNHLGNVLVSITDRKNGVRLSTDTALVDYYLPDIASANDYYPFGMTMPGRSMHSDKYRYGFNGKENDEDIAQAAQDYGMRIYDPRLGRFTSVDPLANKFAWNSVYAFAEGDPVNYIDLDGMERPEERAQNRRTLLQPQLQPARDNARVERIIRPDPADLRPRSQPVPQSSTLELPDNLKRAASTVKMIRTVTSVPLAVLTPLEANAPNPQSAPIPAPEPERAPAPAQVPAPQGAPKTRPGKTREGEDGYYIYETMRDVKQRKGIVEPGKLLPYFGITGDAFSGGRYSPLSVEGINFQQVIGVTNYYTAKGVETALINLNTKGFSMVSQSTRIDNDRVSTNDFAREVSGRIWLNINYPDWQTRFLRPDNPPSSSNQPSQSQTSESKSKTP